MAPQKTVLSFCQRERNFLRLNQWYTGENPGYLFFFCSCSYRHSHCLLPPFYYHLLCVYPVYVVYIFHFASVTSVNVFYLTPKTAFLQKAMTDPVVSGTFRWFPLASFEQEGLGFDNSFQEDASKLQRVQQRTGYSGLSAQKL